MGKKFKSLKNQLRFLEEEAYPNRQGRSSGGRGRGKGSVVRHGLFAAFLISFLLYAGARYSFPTGELNGSEITLFQWGQPDEELLEGMGARMEEMGYTGLTREELIALREDGVTATFTSRMRDLGYTQLSLDDLVRLRQNDVSATFSAMMKELGYDLSMEELIRLRQHNVTAYFTGNMHDMGYAGITAEELIRLKDTGVQAEDVAQLISQNETLPTVEEIIRYRISNQ